MSKINSNSYKNPFLYVQKARKILAKAGYVEFFESDPNWDTSSVNKFFVVRNDRSIIAINKKDTSSALIVSSHNDSPCLKLKPNTKLNRFGYDQVRVAPYGSANPANWMDRELLYAGQVISTRKNENSDNSNNTAEKHIFVTETATTVVPMLAKHLSLNAETYNNELNIHPITNTQNLENDSLNEKHSGQLLKDLASVAGCDVEDIIDFDVALIPAEPTRRIGVSKDMVTGYGLDVLIGSLNALNAFVRAKDPQTGMNVLAIFDNFQITCLTRAGSKGDFLPAVMERIGFTSTSWANSSLLVLENLSAKNPNMPSTENDPFPARTTCSPQTGIYVHAEMCRSSMANLDMRSKLNLLASNAKVSINPIPRPATSYFSIAQDIESRVNVESAIIGIPIIGLGAPRELAFSEDIADMSRFISQFYDGYRLLPSIVNV
ncbi:hypothetical protein TRFO_13295 [Tritrichomonas foetus]|uniref:aspartyl aminopeptidase n=1 Tax=Tritrichomonas foetus TaxID=1144522 RepID=A0A1J4KYH7_9EUKA|nr:hypothetical protein TRFO_13295 [Tritrichomonas foetus]|eukprot:OHT16287.1 hypothetical protein TRFO_13295 [Tritrichomonas foetus]